jgi:hypothetical protein
MMKEPIQDTSIFAQRRFEAALHAPPMPQPLLMAAMQNVAKKSLNGDDAGKKLLAEFADWNVMFADALLDRLDKAREEET